MKKISILVISLLTILLISGCSKQNGEIEKRSDKMQEVKTVKVIINNNSMDLELESNKTAESFVNLLPKEYNMTELNGNEKYVYIKDSLPTNQTNPKTINKGDVYLFGDNCLVIFYKSFETSYSYTKIGHINNLPDLGGGNITVSFEK